MTPAQYETFVDRLRTPGQRTVRQWDDRHEDWHNPPDDADLESLEFRTPMHSIIKALPVWARHVAADAAFRWALTKHDNGGGNVIADLSHQLRSLAVTSHWAIARLITRSAPYEIRPWLAGVSVESQARLAFGRKWLRGWMKQVRGRVSVDSILIRSSQGARVQIPEIQQVRPLPRLGDQLTRELDGLAPFRDRVRDLGTSLDQLTMSALEFPVLFAPPRPPYFSIEITDRRHISTRSPLDVSSTRDWLAPTMPEPEPAILCADFDASGVPRFNAEIPHPEATMALSPYPDPHDTPEEADAPNRPGTNSRGPRSAKRRGRTSRARRGVD